MAAKKFMGKVHQDPGEALAKGSREVMASIWEDYLTAILQVSASSGRFKILRRRSTRPPALKRFSTTGTPCRCRPGARPGAA